MKRTIRSIIGTIAGVFIMLSVISALLAIPEINSVISTFARGMVVGLVISAIIAASIGVAFLYVSIKGK